MNTVLPKYPFEMSINSDPFSWYCHFLADKCFPEICQAGFATTPFHKIIQNGIVYIVMQIKLGLQERLGDFRINDTEPSRPA